MLDFRCEDSKAEQAKCADRLEPTELVSAETNFVPIEFGRRTLVASQLSQWTPIPTPSTLTVCGQCVRC
jgi:hypothetical protein